MLVPLMGVAQEKKKEWVPPKRPKLIKWEPPVQEDPELIDEAFGHLVDLTVDAGMGSLGQSTVVDCHDDELNIVRQGDAELQ